MKSMNFIVNAGAMIFLLLVVHSTNAAAAVVGTILRGETCDYHDVAAATELNQCNSAKGLACRIGGSTQYTGDTQGSPITSGTGGICLCAKDATKPKWIDDATGCGPVDREKKYNLRHGELCNSDWTCVMGSNIKCMLASGVHEDGKSPDTDEAVPSTTPETDGKCGCEVWSRAPLILRTWKGGKCDVPWIIVSEHNGDCDRSIVKICDEDKKFACMPSKDVHSDGVTADEHSANADPGKCGCARISVSEKQVWKDGKCQNKVDDKPEPAGHGAACGGAKITPCKDPFKCHKEGKVDKKGDTTGTLLKLPTSEDGLCVCEGESDKKWTINKDGACGLPVVDNTTDNKDKDATTTSGSERNVYQSISLSLQLSLAAMGSLLMLGSI